MNIELCKSQTIKLILILTLLSIISACATSPTTKLRKIPSSNATPKKILSKNLVDPDLTLFNCANVHIYEHTVVGDGHCVSLIKQCSGAPNTSHWRPGPLVNESDVAKGTIIATFQNGRYPNRTGYHAAIFIEKSEEGIWVWDQWVGKPVHKRLIRHRNKRESTDSNRAQTYRIVTIMSKP